MRAMDDVPVWAATLISFTWPNLSDISHDNFTCTILLKDATDEIQTL